MENEAKLPVEETKGKKASAGGKKKTNKSGANPQGRSRAKSTVLQNFQKNTLANNANPVDSKKPIVTGMNVERFKNLLGMFDKKPEDAQKDSEKPSFGKMNADRMSMFNKVDDSKPCPGEVLNKPRLSIKERMDALMKSKEEMKPQKKIDPILEKLRERNNENEDDEDDDGDSFDNDLSDEDNLDISQEQDKDKDNDNDDLGKSESLSEEKKEDKDNDKDNDNNDNDNEQNKEEKVNEEKAQFSAEEKDNEKDNNNNDNNKVNDLKDDSLNMKKMDLNKSEDLDD